MSNCCFCKDIVNYLSARWCIIRHEIMKTRDWLWMILLSMIWGSAFMFIKIALRELTPFWLIYVRLIMAAGFMTLICRLMKIDFPADWR